MTTRSDREESIAHAESRSKWHHDQAMAACDLGDMIRGADRMTAVASYAHAAKMEAEAALFTTDRQWKAILYRSAAWLALQGGDPDAAEGHARNGLSLCDVNLRTRDELEDVLRVAQEARALVETRALVEIIKAGPRATKEKP